MKPFARRRRQVGWFALLSLITAAASYAAHPAATAMQRPVHEMSARALDWIEHHRASPADGGLPDMIDEAVSLRVFRDLAPTPAESERFARLFEAQLARLSTLSELQRWAQRPHKTLIEHYHLVLAAYLMEGAGLHGPMIELIVQQAQQALGAAATFEPPTVRLTTALFLARLTGGATVDIESLLANSLIGQLDRSRWIITLPGVNAAAQQQRTTTWLLYALVHEVVALTDFGRLAPSPWLDKRRDAVVEILLAALPWASAQHNWDLTAELLVTLYFLDQPLDAGIQGALEELAANQQPDGSWGASATTSRPNKVRHTVLTAAAALMAWHAWREKRPAQTKPVKENNRAGSVAARFRPESQRDAGEIDRQEQVSDHHPDTRRPDRLVDNLMNSDPGTAGRNDKTYLANQ